MKRRSFVFITPALLLAPVINAQTVPVALRLNRRTGWEELMGRNQCIIGDLYHTTPAFPVSDPGTKLCNVLELAYRNNLNDISSIPTGMYEGFIRIGGTRGWRIELTGTGDRKNIQLHVGNRPKDSIGCLPPGTGESPDSSCQIAGSKDAMEKLKSAVGDNLNTKVILKVQA